MRKWPLAAYIGISIFICGTPRAALISSDLAVTGDGLLTRDTQIGIEWLDVTATVGQSRATVMSGAYFTQHGFRYATEGELLTLWTNAGASGPFLNNFGIGTYAGNFAAANLLIQLMGCTSAVLGKACDGTDQNWHIGFFGTNSTDAALVDFFGPPDPRAGTAAMWTDFGPTVDILNRPDVGSFLVRAIPEPSAALLFLSSLLGISALGGRRSVQRDRTEHCRFKRGR